MNGRLSSFLNASRWIAAFLVLIGHVRHLTLADYPHVHAKSLVLAAFYFVTGFGHEAVMIFFVVSGYLVGGLAIVKFKDRGFDFLDYVINRTSRIYTVLIPALLLGGGLDLLGLTFFNSSHLYTNSAQYNTNSLNFVIANNLNFPTLLANIAMLEGVIAQRLGSNGPLWSLVYEWWYYCMFAAAMVVAVKGRLLARILAAAALLAMGLLLPHDLVLWFLMWGLGMAAAVYGEQRLWRPPVWLGLLVFVGVLTVSRLGHSSEASAAPAGLAFFASDLSVALGYAVLLLSFRSDGRKLPFAGGHDWLADFSYTLYLVHFPMLVFCVAVLSAWFGAPFVRQPSVSAFLYFGGILLFLVGYSWLVSRLTETHTPQIRAALSNLVRRGRAAPQKPA